jgi:hypothetical protein
MASSRRTIAQAPASLSDSMFTTPTSGLPACTDTSGVCDGGEKLAHAQGW